MAYRWIQYNHDPLGSFKVVRVTSLEAAKRELLDYCEATGFYADMLMVDGTYGCNASLYPYNEEDWQGAEDFRDTGCPFGYPSKMLSIGPRGGVRVENV